MLIKLIKLIMLKINLKSDSPLAKRNRCYFLQTSFIWKPFKIDEKCFLFHLKSSFRSEDIYVFVMASFQLPRSCIRPGSTPLISKSLTSQLVKQAIATQILPNISRSKGNQTMKLGQSIEYQMRTIFLEKSCTKYGVETIAISFSKKSKLSIFLDQ